MKKFIAVAFSCVIFGCGSVCAVDSSCQEAHIERLRKERTNELKRVVGEIVKQADLLNKEYTVDIGNVLTDGEAVMKLIEIASSIQDKIFLFGLDVPDNWQAKFIRLTGGIMNEGHNLRNLWKFFSNAPDRVHRQKEKLASLEEKIKSLDAAAKEFAELSIEALPLTIKPEEAEKAKGVYQKISDMNSWNIERCIKNSEKLIIQFFCSTERFKEILLGTGNSITKNERDNLNLLRYSIAKQNSYEGVLSIVGCPVFVLGIRSFMNSLVRVCEKNGAARDAGAINELREIFHGNALATVSSIPVSSSSSGSSGQQPGTPTNSPLFPQSGSYSSWPQTSPTIALPFTPAVSQGDSQSQQLGNSAKTGSSIGSSPLLTSNSFSAEYETDPPEWQ